MAKRVIKLFAVEDCKIRKVLTDPEGGAATYGPALDVPGIKNVAISGDVNTVQLRGDNRALESDTVITGLTATYDHAKLSMDVLEVLLGGATVSTAETAVGAKDSKETFTLGADDVFGEYVLEAKTPRYSDGSDVHIRLGKLKLSSFPELGLTEEDYKTVEGLENTMLPLASTGNWFSIISNEKAADISTTFAGA